MSECRLTSSLSKQPTGSHFFLCTSIEGSQSIDLISFKSIDLISFMEHYVYV
jgi:hypothetical protein